MGRVGLPAVEERECRATGNNRGAEFQGAGQPRAVERLRAQDPVGPDPRFDASAQAALRADAQRPASPAIGLLAGSVEPLDPERKGDASGCALAEREPGRGFPRARARDRHVVEPDLGPPEQDREIQLALREALGVVQGGAARARAPGNAGAIGPGRVRGGTRVRTLSFLERNPAPVGGCGAQSGGTRVPQFERGPRRLRGPHRDEERSRGESQRPHRSTTVSARLSLLAGSSPSGIVSPRTT